MHCITAGVVGVMHYLLLMRRIAEVTDGRKQIPFATELESGKWLHDSDMCAHLPHTYALRSFADLFMLRQSDSFRV